MFATLLRSFWALDAFKRNLRDTPADKEMEAKFLTTQELRTMAEIRGSGQSCSSANTPKGTSLALGSACKRSLGQVSIVYSQESYEVVHIPQGTESTDEPKNWDTRTTFEKLPTQTVKMSSMSTAARDFRKRLQDEAATCFHADENAMDDDNLFFALDPVYASMVPLPNLEKHHGG